MAFRRVGRKVEEQKVADGPWVLVKEHVTEKQAQDSLKELSAGGATKPAEKPAPGTPAAKPPAEKEEKKPAGRAGRFGANA